MEEGDIAASAVSNGRMVGHWTGHYEQIIQSLEG